MEPRLVAFWCLAVLVTTTFVAVVAHEMGARVPKEPTYSYQYRLEHGLERRVDNSGRPYTLGPRHEIIYDDPELNRIQTQFCLSGRVHPSRCGF